MNKTCSALLMVVVILVMQPSYAQQVNSQDISEKTKSDSLLDTYSIEEIIKFRDYYQQQIDSVEKKKIAFREQTILVAEKFVKENPESKVLDKVLLRLAELYTEIADETFLNQMQEYEQLLEDSSSTQVVTNVEEPKRDYSKSLAIYERIINKMPQSNFVEDAFNNKGYLLKEIGEVDSALQIQYQIKSKFGESGNVPEVLMNIADYYFNSPHNLLDSAITYYKKVLDHKGSSKFDEALYMLGRTYYRLKDYAEAIYCFTFLVDDIKRAQSFDPEQKFTYLALRDQALEHIGICFVDYGGTSAAVEYISNLGTPDYAFDILRILGDRYMGEKEQYEDAIRTYTTLLMMYPDHVKSPEIHEQIVSCFLLQRENLLAYLQRDELFNLYKPGSDWWERHAAEAVRENVYQVTEAALRNNINFMFQQADSNKTEKYYRLAIAECQK